MKEETTKHMIRTPYGVLTMPFGTYSQFAVATEDKQWRALLSAARKGLFAKARCMQWFWNQRARREQLRLN